jgi:hypothetical protein
MKFKLLALAVLASAVTVAACSDDNAPPATTTRLRAVHLSPDAPNVNILVNGSQVASNVAYEASTDYYDIPSGTTRIQVQPVGTTTNAIDASPSLLANTDYTVIAANLVASIEPLLLTDNNTAPTAGNVKVRIVHGAPSAPAVDVYITVPGVDIAVASPTLTDVAFKGVSAYQTVPAGTYQIRVTPTGTKTVVIDSGDVPLTAGQIRTVIATDAPGGGEPFGAIVLDDLN